MISYLKLLHHELTRVRRFYLFMLILIFVMQIGGLFYYAKGYMDKFDSALIRGSVASEAQYANSYGYASLFKYANGSLWFMAPIGLCVAVMGIYILAIWYRDWFGRNPFVYRLLTLPVSRMNLFWAKLSAIVLLVLGLVGFQMLLLLLQQGILASRIPDGLRVDHPLTEVVHNHPLLQTVAPGLFSDFLFFYGLGTAAVAAIFTAVLLERSFRLRGAVLGILYTLAAVGLFILPLYLFLEAFPYYLYDNELLAVQLGTIGIIAAASCVLSSYLIKHKVMV